MNYPKSLFLCLLASCMLGRTACATVLLDATWADGTRTTQNLPADSAWWSSSGSALVATTGSMTLTMPGIAVMGLTYFTTNANIPAQLAVGDTLTATFTMTFGGLSAGNTSQNFRLGLLDYADSTLSPKRVTADLSSNDGQGSGVRGYALFQNMATTFNNSTPMLIRARTNLPSTKLLGTSTDWKTLTSGPGDTNGFPGFANGIPYILQFSLQRTNSSSLLITVTWQNTSSGASLSTSFADTGATNFNFDGISFRPSDATTTASTITFSEIKVEVVSANTPPSIDLDPQDESLLVGQDASFSVQASGSPPLSYFWYYNTNTFLTNTSIPSLTVSNAQLTDAGGYSVIVSNAYGSATSAVAQLTVSTPVAPSIASQPQDQLNILPGGTTTFTVVAGGTTPFSYQWYYNTNTMLANATDATLILTNVQPANAGAYSVTVSNIAGGVVSSNAFLTIDTSPVAPVFNSQPASLVVLAGSTVSFTATASGTAPIYYQWSKDGVPIAGATSSTLSLTNVQTTNDGAYTLTASNSVASVSSSPAQLTVTLSVPVINSAYNLVGFAQGTTGGGVIPETDPAYRKVYNALDLANAVLSAYKTAGSVKVIEIMNDLDLGWNEVGSAVQTLSSTPFRSHNTPQLHPRLLVTGVSLIDIKPKSGLTIFSANGATIRHATFNIKSTSNVIVRNLKFDEMWEWDEATKGKYDKNDWDFIDLGNGGSVSNIWVDHCTFTKSYDGILDTKAGSSLITLSWCNYTGDDGATNTNSFVRQQINKLELSPSSYAMYNFLRTHGFSVEDIVAIIQGHDKTHLAGSNDKDPKNATLSLTFHHLWFNSVWDRCVPRLRAGNVHDFNNYVDDTLVLAAKRLRDARAAAMSTANQNTLNNTYSFRPPINGSISTEGGALLVEKAVYIDCLTPLRNNQTDPSDPTYTGKILGLDTIYQMDSTVIRGNSTDPGNPLGPVQAPIIAFSWNLPGNHLPYNYTLDDPSQLQTIVTSPTAGAGAGVLTWPKTNWLVTSYPATAPSIVSDPQGQTVTVGNNATLTVVASGSAPLSYQWYFNTNTLIANATNAFLNLTNIQGTNAGNYSVHVANAAGSTNSAYAALVVTLANSAPTLAAIADTNVIAGATLLITNSASDSDTPAQTLTFSLLNPPANATVSAGSGILSWRPAISQANASYPISVKVVDSGSPSLSATQSFNVFVTLPATPQVTSPSFNGGQFSLTINGDAGPDYIVSGSTNLTDWSPIATNSSPALPLLWTDPDSGSFTQRFYRVLLGP